MPTDFQLLGTFLTTEGFLLAAVSLSANLGTPNRLRPPILPFNVHRVTIAAAIISCLMGVGAVISWLGLYVVAGGHLLPAAQVFQAAFLLVAAVAQPILAVLLALAVLDKKKK